MSWTRTLTVLGATAGLAASAVALSPAAHAAATPSTITVTCVTSGQVSTLTLSAPMVTLSPGDSFTFVNNVGSDLTLTLPSGSTTSDTIAPLANGASANITVNSAGSISVTGAAGGACGVTRTLALNTGGGGGRPASSTSAAPAPIVQEFGRAVSGTCDSAAHESMNWAGVTSGGWGESWAQWMNGGTGGAVCTRTLVYSTSQSRWVVG